MATISKLTAGQIVYERVSRRMGNTTCRRKSLYRIKIISVDIQGEKVTASWNGNTAREYSARSVKKWLVKKPEPKGSFCGSTCY